MATGLTKNRYISAPSKTFYSSFLKSPITPVSIIVITLTLTLIIILLLITLLIVGRHSLNNVYTLALLIVDSFSNISFFFPELPGASGIGGYQSFTRLSPILLTLRDRRYRRRSCKRLDTGSHLKAFINSSSLIRSAHPPSMFRRLRLIHILLTFFLLTSIASAWPWPPSYRDIEGLILRRQDDSKSGKISGDPA